MVTSLYPYMKAVNEFVGGPMMAWVDRKKDLVKWLGLAALASGVLLVVLGGLGIVAGAVGAGLAMVGSAVAVIVSPIGIATAAIAAGAALVISIGVRSARFSKALGRGWRLAWLHSKAWAARWLAGLHQYWPWDGHFTTSS